MTENITYRLADKNDLFKIKDLLNRNGLPSSDIDGGIIDFIVATHNDQNIIGCIGVEQYGADGLLRSFAVEQSHRNKKIGSQLFSRLLSYSRQAGVMNMHLLTTTAEKYFLAKGFSVTAREAAPQQIQSTTEFSSLCPASSAYMVMRNISDKVFFYSAETQNIVNDEETGSSYWSIQGNNLQFTWFEVPPHKKFSNHRHAGDQITHVLEGELFFGFEDSVLKVSKGDSIVIPANKEHRVWTENHFAKAIDAWSPVNEKYSQNKKNSIKQTP